MKKLALTLILLMVVPALYAGDGQIHKPPGQLVKDSYVVTFVAGQADPGARANELARTHGAQLNRVYRYALQGAHFLMNESQAGGMAHNPHVASVTQEYLAEIVGDQSNPTWGIDRVDQRNLPLSNSYHWDYDGTGVNAYIMDTGIRITHNDFGGRASWGIDCTGEGSYDGHGHGTHVAGTVGSATYGVAKNVNLISAKICTAGGSCPSAAILCGIDYATQQKHNNPSIPMVANMSIRGPRDTTMNNAVNNSVAAGVFYAVAAGNDYGDACDWSPASAADAYTTGATNSSDAQASFSNSGVCVDIHAPGVSILSTYASSDTATATMSGTSMASPHVCGGGALVFDQYPTWTPFQVMDELTARATVGVISPIDPGSPNLLLYTLGTFVPCTGDPDCDDGLWCNGAETCNLGTGQCEPGTPVVCDDGVECTDDSCNEGTDSCDYVPNDLLCDDGLFCTGVETCDAVLGCLAGPDPCFGEPCDEGNNQCPCILGQFKDPCYTDADCCPGLTCHPNKKWCK